MEKATIRIKKKESGGLKKEFRGKHKNLSIPQEFIFTEEYDGECDIELNQGKLVKIVIQGKEIPKSDTIAKEKKAKTEAKLKQAEKEKKRQEEERKTQKQKNQNPNNMAKNLYNINNTKLPKNTKLVLTEVLTDLSLIDNYSLKLNKTVNFIEKKPILYRKETKDKDNQLVKFEIPFDFRILNNDLINSIQIKQRNQLKSLSLAKIESQVLSLDWRLALGLGNASVYETSITLHHIYGIPYIPASSVKGIVHHWAIDHIKEIAEKENSEALTKKWQEIKEVFGAEWDKNPVNPEILSDKNQQGSIIFFDAFPTSAPTVEPDIMNVHYKDYYNESIDKARTYPTDYQSPNPIPFLTVKDCSFQFIIGVKKGDEESLKLLDIAKDWLKNALTQKGIGAKTAVGYGYMNPETT